MENLSEIEYQEAKKAVKEKIGFYWHLASYVIVNLYLLFIYFQGRKEGETYFWNIWVILGWGIGLAFHALKTFGFFNSKSWEEKQIQKEIEKRRQQRERLMK